MTDSVAMKSALNAPKKVYLAIEDYVGNFMTHINVWNGLNSRMTSKNTIFCLGKIPILMVIPCPFHVLENLSRTKLIKDNKKIVQKVVLLKENNSF